MTVQRNTSRALAVGCAMGVMLVSQSVSGGVDDERGQTGLPTAVLSYPAGPPRVPIGYDPAPERPALGVRSPQIDGPGFSVTITNRGTVPIERLRYVAIVERQGWKEPVRLLHSVTWMLSLKAGDTAHITSEWLNAAVLDELTVNDQGRTQIFLAPAHVRYADGTEWNVRLDPKATTHRTAMRLPEP